MIPDFGKVSGNLPKGEHLATWQEVVEKLGFSQKRRELLVGLQAACIALRSAGVSILYLDGSFATKKWNPSDWDACYSGVGVDEDKLDPVFLDFDNDRAAQKAKYKGECFVAESIEFSTMKPFRDFFQADKNNRPKGILALDLGTVP